MNPTYLGLEVKRVLRDPVTLFFAAGLPAFFYLIFGASQDYKDEPLAHGNVGMAIMIAMAAYGAVNATVGIGGRSAVERSQGWGRQLGLTPMTDGGFVRVKVALAVLVAAVPIALVYALGLLTGARGEPWVWVVSAVVLVAGAVVFSLYGLSFGLAFGSESAVSAAGGSVVILGFLGNIFFPLSGTLLTVARLTPMYGYASLARYPLTGGAIVSGDGAPEMTEALWQPLVNVGAWMVVLAVVATVLVRRGRGRQ